MTTEQMRDWLKWAEAILKQEHSGGPDGMASAIIAALNEAEVLKTEHIRLKDRMNNRPIYYPIPTGRYEVGSDGVERPLYEQGETTASELIRRAVTAEAEVGKLRGDVIALSDSVAMEQIRAEKAEAEVEDKERDYGEALKLANYYEAEVERLKKADDKTLMRLAQDLGVDFSTAKIIYDKPTTEEADPCDSEEFAQFQRQNHCSHISFDDLERWYFRADKERDTLKAEVEQLRDIYEWHIKQWNDFKARAEKAEAEVERLRLYHYNPNDRTGGSSK